MWTLLTASEGASNLEELKEKVKTPSVLAKIKAQEWAKEEAERAAKAREAEEAAVKEAKESKTTERKVSSQGKGDRAGVKVGSTLAALTSASWLDHQPPPHSYDASRRPGHCGYLEHVPHNSSYSRQLVLVSHTTCRDV